MNKALFATLYLLVSCCVAAAADPYVVVLGVGQDAGVPQMGCGSVFCAEAFKDPTMQRMVSSIALVDPDSGNRWIFDATPDLPSQFEMLKDITGDRTNALSGIFLTHAHIGHYTGLMYLGRESMNAAQIPVWAMPRMKRYLENNGPWSQLVALGNVKLSEMADGVAVGLPNKISVTPFIVPHRDEFSETVGFRIAFGKFSVVFVPDIDKWQKWEGDLKALVRANDVLLVDGTFFRDGEIPRPISEVPHPFVEESMELLRDLDASQRRKVHFIHFNHSNPIVQRSEKEIREVRAKGFEIARQGLVIRMGNASGS